MKRVLAIAMALLLSACAGIVKVEGDQVIQGKLSVKLTDAWNKVSLPGSKEPFEVWTQEGLTLDQLRFWSAIAPGQSISAPPPTNVPAGQKAPRVPTYVAGMQPDQLVNLFEILHSNDGSLVTMNKVEPAMFAGVRGVRFEMTIVRKGDGVTLSCMGWVAVHNGQLYAATFFAPRLGFYSRLAPRAEAVVRSASIKG